MGAQLDFPRREIGAYLGFPPGEARHAHAATRRARSVMNGPATVRGSDIGSVFAPIRDEMERVERSLFELSRSGNARIARAVEATLSAGGKRLRPAVLLLSSKAAAAGSTDVDPPVSDRTVRLAAAVELVHTASLLHDDVIDGATERRGSPSVNALWGNKVSVLAGDHLFACVMRVAARDGTLAMVQGIASVAGRMTDGECAQSLTDGIEPMDEVGYLSMIEGKTAFLFSCAAQVGARMGYGGEQKVEAMSAFGREFGMAFQITDDVLDVTGEASVLGKEPGTDLREGRWTLPFIHALTVLPPADGDRLRRAFATDGSRSDEEVRHLRRLAGTSGGLSYSVAKARGFADDAKARLRGCEPSPSRDALTALVDCMVDRVAAFG